MKPINPQKEEYLEAEQQKTDNIRNKFLSSLSEEERKKFEIVDEVVNKLVENNIPFYLFPYLLDGNNSGKSSCWQWNSMTKLVKFEPNGSPTEESMQLVSRINASLMTILFWTITNYFTPRDTELKERFKIFIEYVGKCLQENAEYMGWNNQIKNDSEKTHEDIENDGYNEDNE